jgi:hypothetical protein
MIVIASQRPVYQDEVVMFLSDDMVIAISSLFGDEEQVRIKSRRE